eukprot:TRINITY_DN33308_c0_g1_i1.p1 TRINITY_DN33308_c0_g1~~TRINITY_DN33308_c0_g1_i1.p1  ORF type:complete len:956 (-),score=150.21 TRINITY_DN33308_c0_g1_i1:278-2872(-)
MVSFRETVRIRLRRAQPWSAKCVDKVSVQVIMFLATVYALMGDDVRMASTPASADNWFNCFTILAFLLFSFEMCVASIGKDDYFMSFFFFLDLLATVSLVLDITWFYTALFQTDSSLTRAGRMSRMGTRAGRVIRVLRLIRLIRIIKIYKHVLDLRDSIKGRNVDEVPKPGEGTDEEIYAESRVGMKLSHMTTQKVILLILFMLIMLPIITVETFFNDLPTSSQYGADSMHRAWKECFSNVSTIACQNFEEQLTMYIGYHHRQHLNKCDRAWNQVFDTNCKLDLGWVGFIEGSNQKTFNVDKTSSIEDQRDYIFAGVLTKRLIDSLENSIMTDCKHGRYISLFEGEDLECPEQLRMQEIKPVYPQMANIEDDAEIVLVFDLRPWMLKSSVYNIFQTVFICAILAAGAMVFSHDANVLVLQPIERMISKVEKIRDNPLYAMKLGDEAYRQKQEEEENPVESLRTPRDERKRCTCFRRKKNAKEHTLETKILENAIIKLGKLLALGFGEAGSEIIGKNMNDDSATVNAMIPGNKVEAVFGFCNIRNFTDMTEVLQDKIMVFVNQVAEIVHGIVDTWHGAANRNLGDAFLIIWRMREDFSPETKTKMGDMSVMSFVQVVAAINKSFVLRDYREHPALLARLPNYRVRVGFGLHYGWAIEGAIGSEFKIDASYLSPHVNMASRLEAVTKQYGVSLLMSEPLIQLCSDEMSRHFRAVDHVTLKGGMSTSIHLHTLDLHGEALKTECEDAQQRPSHGQNQFELRLQREKAKDEKMQSLFLVHQCFETDPDVRVMRKDFPVRFFQLFTKGFLNYEAGEWDVAKSVFETTIGILGEVDGPSRALLNYMSQFDFVSSRVSPKGWPGWRELTDC